MKNKKERLSRIGFMLTGVVFLLTGIDLFDQGKPTSAILQIIAGGMNLIMLTSFISERRKANVSLAILVMNIIVAITTATDFILAGKKYIQYAWIAVAVISASLLVMQIRNKGRITNGGK